MLPSKRGVRKGAAFLFGWLVSLAIVVTVTVLATGNNPPKPNAVPSLASLAVKIAIGTFLVLIAIRSAGRWGGRCLKFVAPLLGILLVLTCLAMLLGVAVPALGGPVK